MNLREYCELVYDSTISAASLPKGSPAEIRVFVDQLSEELRQEYAERGYPNGKDEESMVEYLLKNVQVEIENIRKEGRTHG